MCVCLLHFVHCSRARIGGGGSESDRRVVKELILQHDPLVEKGLVCGQAPQHNVNTVQIGSTDIV